jgi:hypothetical protein
VQGDGWRQRDVKAGCWQEDGCRNLKRTGWLLKARAVGPEKEERRKSPRHGARLEQRNYRDSWGSSLALTGLPMPFMMVEKRNKDR